MANRWPDKDPYETLDYSMDWREVLYEGTSVSTVRWYVEVDGVRTLFTNGTTLNNLTNEGESNTTRVTTINLSGGNVNETYIISCAMTDSTGSTTLRTLPLGISRR